MPRRLQLYSTPEIAVTYDPTRCIHHAACVRGLADVFRPKERPWIRLEYADADAIAEVVTRCPTGALHFERADGVAEVVPDELTVRSTRDGPLFVRGAVRLCTADGEGLAVTGRMALCRCGHTRNAPFCDGSHHDVGFRDPV